ncbi:retinol dehydrogenase 7-like, partial [Dreissena polymorpha]
LPDSGFGNLLAKRLDRNGVNVIAGCLTSDGAAALRNACSQTLKTVELDVSKETSIRQAKERVLKLLPAGKGLWALVNNAGISGTVGPIEWQTQADYRSVIEINLFGVIFVTNAFLPLVRHERGRVVNMASIIGRFAMACGPYSAAKYGVEGFSDQLRRELYKTGVTVHIIEPGYFQTGIVSEERMRKDIETRFQKCDKELQEYYGETFKLETQQKFCSLLSLIMSPKIHKVVDAYDHAVLSMFPKNRYVVGFDANILFRILWNLPEWLSDFIVTRPMATPAGAKK